MAQSLATSENRDSQLEPDDVQGATISRFKRRIAQLEQDVDIARNANKPLKKKDTVLRMGRGLRRLASMFEGLQLMIFEADRRALADDSDEPEESNEETRLQQERTFKGFRIMLSMVPALRTMLTDPDTNPEGLDRFVAILQQGASNGRTDDSRNVREAVGNWLNLTYKPKPEDVFDVNSRAKRGLQNDITGSLLCPVDYDWSDEKTRLDIKAGRLVIKDDLYLACFYPKGRGDPDNVEHKFLKSSLLVKTYCVIFTAPTSAENFDTEETEDGPVRKKGKTSSQKKATKSNVANLLHMNNTVTPRSIAYAAVLLAFNLTDAGQWVETYNSFSYPVLWDFIVDFFEAPADDQSKKHADDLIMWWNKKVFPQHYGTSGSSTSMKAREKLRQQRLRRLEVAARSV
ncbi:hypothetical protein BJ165DRAFT_1524262 [Panaeolus papilionaceus]|nr:hypothetical protein BJ165DRAFT_1524262 [Panaeolus papilionaceus]